MGVHSQTPARVNNKRVRESTQVSGLSEEGAAYKIANRAGKLPDRIHVAAAQGSAFFTGIFVLLVESGVQMGRLQVVFPAPISDSHVYPHHKRQIERNRRDSKVPQHRPLVASFQFSFWWCDVNRFGDASWHIMEPVSPLICRQLSPTWSPPAGRASLTYSGRSELPN